MVEEKKTQNSSIDDSAQNNSNEINEEEILENTLRPKTWDEYIGQEKIKINLKVIIEAAKKRGEPCCEHILFYGGSGLGKTTLAGIVARELGTNFRITSGTAIKKVGDLAAILSNLSPGDVLFIDEIHRLNKMIEEFLYPAMEEFKMHLVLGKGVMARTMEIQLPKFTLIGATTRMALVSAPLRSRFGATFQLDYYLLEDLEKIIKRAAYLLQVKIEDEAVKKIALASRFTPRVANRLLKRVRDFAQVQGKDIITPEIAQKALEFLEIDDKGLEAGDRKLLEVLITKFNGGPVGLKSLAAAASEEEDTILDIYEPYLLRLGFIERTPRGRIATPLAYKHLNIKKKDVQKLF
jgi:Holliday junction DNA helicase RuvB